MTWRDAGWVGQGLLPVLVGLGMVLGPGLAVAEKADRAAPMNVQADAMRHDEQKQVTELIGGVVISKGSIVMRGGRIEVRVDAQGRQSAKISSTPETVAFFRQKREGVNEFIEGEAEEIVFDGAADTVTFSKRSTLRRYAGAVLMDELKGAKIVYDNATDRYAVEGGASNVSSVNPSGRVTAVLSAKPKSDVIAAPPAPPSSAPLRTTTRIGEKTN